MSELLLTYVDSLDEVDEFRRWLGQKRDWLACDIETSGLRFWCNDIRLVQLGDTQRGWAFPFDKWKGVIQETLPNYRGNIVFHNPSFDLLFLEDEGIKLPWRYIEDSMTMAYLFDSSDRKGLKYLAAKHLHPAFGLGEQELKELMHRRRWTWDDVPIDHPTYWQYSALDTVLTARLAEFFWPKLDEGSRAVYDLEIATLEVICGMERRGLQVDTAYGVKALEEWEHTEHLLRQRVRDEFGIQNATSQRQVAERLLRDGVELYKRTRAGEYELTDAVLQNIDHPLAQLVHDIRWVHKAASTWVRPILEACDSNDRIHPSINPLLRTGRMSIKDPPMQTLAKKAEVRNVIIPSIDNALISADYQQMELRAVAHFANEQRMLDAFRNGEDLHAATARIVYGHEPNRRERSIGKSANFAKVFAAGAPKFAITAGIPIREAQEFFTRYKQEFPGVDNLLQQVISAAKRRRIDEGKAYVRTPFGNRLVADEGGDKDYALLNYLIQGSCAVVLKRALVDLADAGLSNYIALPIHDEVLFDVPKEEAQDVASLVTEIMCDYGHPPEWKYRGNPPEWKWQVALTAESDILEKAWGEKYID